MKAYKYANENVPSGKYDWIQVISGNCDGIISAKYSIELKNCSDITVQCDSYIKIKDCNRITILYGKNVSVISSSNVIIKDVDTLYLSLINLIELPNFVKNMSIDYCDIRHYPDSDECKINDSGIYTMPTINNKLELSNCDIKNQIVLPESILNLRLIGQNTNNLIFTKLHSLVKLHIIRSKFEVANFKHMPRLELDNVKIE